MSTDASAIQFTKNSRRASSTAALAASSIEYYDFLLYATAAALVFPAVFFQTLSPVVGVLLSFGSFASAYLMRPIGAIVFGHIGDRIGRKKALTGALVLMAVATVGIGLTPTYAVVGPFAPALLVVLRLAQGIAFGGQWGGAVLTATENAPAARRGFYGSFAQLGLPVGIILADLIFLIVVSSTSADQLMTWGWRIPFLLSVILFIVAYLAQRRLTDTADFERVKQSQSRSGSPVIEVLRTHPKQVILAGGAFLATNSIGYIGVSYMLSYGTAVLGLSKATMLTIVLLTAATWIPGIIGFSILSDRIGRRVVFMSGAALLGLWAFPLFWLIDTGIPVLIFVGLAIASIFKNMMFGPQAAMFTEMFSTRVRYSGVSMGYQLGALLGGAFAPAVATALYTATGNTVLISTYILGLSLISFGCVLCITGVHVGKRHSRPAVAPVRTPAAEPIDGR